MSNIKLNEKGRRGFKQGKLIENFFLLSHNGTYEDIKVQIIGHCDPTVKKLEKTFGFSFWTLCTQKVYIKSAH